MAFNVEVHLIANRYELINGQTDIHFHNTMALRAGQVMMMTAPTNPIVMRPIGELDTVQHTSIDQHFHRAVDRCSSQTWFCLSEFLPELISREVASIGGKLYKLLCDESPRTCVALAHFVESCINFVHNSVHFLYVSIYSSALHLFLDRH